MRNEQPLGGFALSCSEIVSSRPHPFEHLSSVRSHACIGRSRGCNDHRPGPSADHPRWRDHSGVSYSEDGAARNRGRCRRQYARVVRLRPVRLLRPADRRALLSRTRPDRFPARRFGTFAAGSSCGRWAARCSAGSAIATGGSRRSSARCSRWRSPPSSLALLPDAATIGLARPGAADRAPARSRASPWAASTWPRPCSWSKAAEPGRRGWMGSWGPFGASAGTLLGSAAGALVNMALPPEAVMA